MNDEWQTKRDRLGDFFERHELDGVFLQERRNFAWITGGGDNHIPNNSETGVAAIFATAERRVCLANAIEAPRMRDEELAGTDIEVVDFPWHDERAARKVVRNVLGARRVAGDVDPLGLSLLPLPNAFAELRFALTPEEVERYREGGRRAAAALESTCRELEPGMTEHEIVGLLDHHVRASGLTPVVSLISTDERLPRYRHPIATDRKLERHVMLVSCGVYRGLISNLTRFVHIGPLSNELAKKQQSIANIDAAVNLATKPGRALGDVFADLQEAYARENEDGQWQLHHQGGPTGYTGREEIVTPESTTLVRDKQAFAWNPSIVGAKSEDTALISDQGVDVLTKHSDDWPTVTGTCPLGDMRRPAILER